MDSHELPRVEIYGVLKSGEDEFSRLNTTCSRRGVRLDIFAQSLEG
jgi:hypothetical protein